MINCPCKAGGGDSMPIFRDRLGLAPHAARTMADRSFGPRSGDCFRGANPRLTTGKYSGIGLRRDRNRAGFVASALPATRVFLDLVPAPALNSQALCPETIRRPVRLADVHVGPAAGPAWAMPRCHCDQSAPPVGTNNEGCWQLSFIAGVDRFRSGRCQAGSALTGRYAE